MFNLTVSFHTAYYEINWLISTFLFISLFCASSSENELNVFAPAGMKTFWSKLAKSFKRSPSVSSAALPTDVQQAGFQVGPPRERKMLFFSHLRKKLWQSKPLFFFQTASVIVQNFCVRSFYLYDCLAKISIFGVCSPDVSVHLGVHLIFKQRQLFSSLHLPAKLQAQRRS